MTSTPSHADLRDGAGCVAADGSETSNGAWEGTAPPNPVRNRRYWGPQGGRSTSKKKRVPHPGRVSTWSSQSIACTSLRHMVSPSPVSEKHSRRRPVDRRNGWYRIFTTAG